MDIRHNNPLNKSKSHLGISQEQYRDRPDSPTF